MAKANLPCFPKIKMTFGLIVLILLLMEAQGRGPTPEDEVKALQEIAEQLGKKNWNFNIDPCINDTNWTTPTSNMTRTLHNNTVECNCSYVGGVCHVVNIIIQGQDLSGVLPPSLVKLPYLKKMDLNWNYLSGTIPREWASLQLEYLIITANNLSGPIDYLGNIPTLQALSIESNLFSGNIPPELGNLVNLEILFLSANNLTGELPGALTNLTKLKELRISSNNFTGRIPDFFQSWKELQKLEIQASGLRGPIPSSIFVLTNLIELRISDLLGEGSQFPQLSGIKNMKRLMLRSCNISGPIPGYISEMADLTELDLSFNRLEGNIPNLQDQTQLTTIILTSNLLKGLIPDWIMGRNNRYNIDISYNNFSNSSAPNTCPSNINLFKSFSEQDNSILTECLKDSPCSKDQYSLYINCGGKALSIGKINYESDVEPGAASKFFRTRDDTWGFSSTGDFWDINNTAHDFIANNVSLLRMNDSELYMNARLSPLSFTYYMRCLAKGNYTIKLHFAEIIFEDNRSFFSVGRRIFDVYIQEKLVLKDFDIEKEAQGAAKVVIKDFTAVVENKILEIRFHWSGKGTTNIPNRGTYGPLISAISIYSDSIKKKRHSIEKKRVVIIVSSVVLATGMTILGLVFFRRKKILGKKGIRKAGHIKDNINEEWKEDLELPVFDLTTIVNVTDNFSSNNKLGQGGFGPVYKGTLMDGQEIAVKRLSKNSGQGLEEFKNEVILIAKLQHRNLVKLLGCCIEGDEKLLIYEFMPNKSLDFFIFDQTRSKLLDWHKRFNIIGGIARGLLYLHQDSRLRIIHRDLKTSNILLDKDINPKISDFGMARTFWEDQTEENTNRIVGTYGYMSPEYAIDGLFSIKSDVFSFGVIILEMVSGRKNRGFYHEDHNLSLLGHAWRLWIEEKALELLDLVLSEAFSLSEVLRCIHVGLLCVQQQPEDRPNMSTVVLMLGNDGILPSPKQPGFYTERNPQPVADSSSRKHESCFANEMSFTVFEAR